MEKLKAGIISLQHLHPISYIPLLENSNIELVGVSETDTALFEERKKDLPKNIKYYIEYKDLIQKEKPDIVFIFSPLDTCPDVVECAAGNKTNIIIEKPIASTLSGGKKILDLCKKNKIFASVPYVWRYHSASREIKKYIDKGYLGEIQALEGRCIAGRIDRYISAHSEWIIERSKSGGGAMWNLGPHWIDLFRWLLNYPEPERVYAEYTNFTKKIDIEENSHGIIKYKNGVVAILNIGYSSPPSFPYGRDLHINIRGTLGSITWNPAYEGSDDEIFICSDHKDFSGAPNRTIKMRQKSLGGYAGMMGYEYLDEVVNSIKKKKPPFIGMDDAVEVLKITDAMNRSAKENKVIYL